MKKSYISPNIEVEYISEDYNILAGSPPPGNGIVDLGNPEQSPTTEPDNRTDQEIGGYNGGDALSKKNGLFFESEW